MVLQRNECSGTRKGAEVLIVCSLGRMFGNPRVSDLCGGHCYVRVTVTLLRSLGKGGRECEALGSSFSVVTRSCALVGMLALSRLTELVVRAQNPVSWETPLPSLQSGSVTTISGENPVFCLLGKSEFDHCVAADRILS